MREISITAAPLNFSFLCELMQQFDGSTIFTLLVVLSIAVLDKANPFQQQLNKPAYLFRIMAPRGLKYLCFILFAMSVGFLTFLNFPLQCVSF